MDQSDKISNRRRNRIAAVQFLYSWDSSPSDDVEKSLNLFLSLQEGNIAHFNFTIELVKGTIDNITEIDALIKSHSQNWTFQRIAKTDLAILRMSIFELLHRNDIPPIVSINEAIDLAKIFSDEDSKRFVNGILDKIKAQITRPLRSSGESPSE